MKLKTFAVSTFLVLINNETNRKLLESFFNGSSHNTVLIFENSDSLNILTKFPNQFKSKITLVYDKQNQVFEHNVADKLNKQCCLI